MFVATLFTAELDLYLEITGSPPRCWKLPTMLDSIPELAVLAEVLRVDGEVPEELTPVLALPDGAVKLATYAEGRRIITPAAPFRAVGYPRFVRYSEDVKQAGTDIEGQLTLADIAEAFKVGYGAAREWMSRPGAPAPVSPANTRPIRWHRAAVEAYLLDPANPDAPKGSTAIWRARAEALAAGSPS